MCRSRSSTAGSTRARGRTRFSARLPIPMGEDSKMPKFDNAPLFASFWQAGFESASHRNEYGVRVDMLAATQHVEQAEEDYSRLRSLGIRVAREGVRWHLVEQGGGFDFSTLTPIVAAA